LERIPEDCYWSGLDEAPSSTREDFRGAFTDIKLFMPEVEIYYFVHEFHICYLEKWKKQEFEEKKYYIPLLSYVAFQK